MYFPLPWSHSTNIGTVIIRFIGPDAIRRSVEHHGIGIAGICIYANNDGIYLCYHPIGI
jgi:hypothetical protein